MLEVLVSVSNFIKDSRKCCSRYAVTATEHFIVVHWLFDEILPVQYFYCYVMFLIYFPFFPGKEPPLLSGLSTTLLDSRSSWIWSYAEKSSAISCESILNSSPHCDTFICLRVTERGHLILKMIIFRWRNYLPSTIKRDNCSECLLLWSFYPPSGGCALTLQYHYIFCHLKLVWLHFNGLLYRTNLSIWRQNVDYHVESSDPVTSNVTQCAPWETG